MSTTALEQQALNNIRIVLVETSHTGNIGSVARAMKTMGLSQLVLVNPLIKPDSQAIAMAAGASDIIQQAKIVHSLDDALQECRLVVGTSARSRTLPWPMLEPASCGEKMVTEAIQSSVALVFGRERVGLTNEELQKCDYHVAIQANPVYSSLNLAMAVQILCYEIRQAWLRLAVNNNVKAEYSAIESIEYPLHKDLELFFDQLEQVLQKTEFIRTTNPGPIMSRLRRLFNRARPESQEINILRGVIKSVENKIAKQ